MKLLDTRNGRCGEWANCFTALCIAIGHDARFVLDWTDHVWTECYIKSEERWVHMDPCENAYDSPKMYERGWGKKLTYVLAFSLVEVVDVTHRYTLNKVMNRMRRDQVPEQWLKDVLTNLRMSLLTSLPFSER
jgi:peptide-N4-(N-acetyl-beta-glucosaminyl)asparagine amidase